MNQIICGTGHRPSKLGGYGFFAQSLLIDFATFQLDRLKPKLVISGMALGWDQALAAAAWTLKIPYNAYIPFIGQEFMWPEESQKRYEELLKGAASVVNSCGEGYAAWKMQKRNEDMVNASDLVLALWNGTTGGTSNCVSYASKNGVEILNVWDEWEQYQ